MAMAVLVCAAIVGIGILFLVFMASVISAAFSVGL